MTVGAFLEKHGDVIAKAMGCEPTVVLSVLVSAALKEANEKWEVEIEKGTE